MAEGIAYNDRVLIAGSTGGGKSVLARYLFEHMVGVRRTLVDVKDCHDLGVERARTPAELDLAAPVSHYVPALSGDDEYEELFDRLWASRTMGPRVIWIDESFGPTRAGYAPRGLRLANQQGREKGIGVIACTQRVQGIEATLRTEANHALLFPLTMMDIKPLAPDLGLEPEQLRKALNDVQDTQGEHAHLWYRRSSRELVPCAPLPAAWARRRGPLRAAGAGGEQGEPPGGAGEALTASTGAQEGAL